MQQAGPIDPSLRIASVRRGVGDLQRSTDFYEHVLGRHDKRQRDTAVVEDPDGSLLSFAAASA